MRSGRRSRPDRKSPPLKWRAFFLPLPSSGRDAGWRSGIVEHGGRIFKTTGDGLLAAFPSVVEAVRAAVKIQQALGVRSDSADADRRRALRIGVHVGAAAFRKTAGRESD